MRRFLHAATLAALLVLRAQAQGQGPANGPGDSLGSIINATINGIRDVENALGRLICSKVVADISKLNGIGDTAATCKVNSGQNTAGQMGQQTTIQMPSPVSSSCAQPPQKPSTATIPCNRSLTSPPSPKKAKRGAPPPTPPTTPPQTPPTPPQTPPTPPIFIDTVIPVDPPDDDPIITTICDLIPDVPVYFVDHTNNRVLRAMTCSPGITTISVCSRPLQLEMSPDLRQAYVTCFDNEVDIIDAASGQVTARIKTNSQFNPSGIAMMPDGTRAYVTSFNNDRPMMSLLDTATRTFVQNVPLPDYPQSVFLSPDAQSVWVTFPLSSGVGIYDTLTNTLNRSLSISTPIAVAFHPNGTRAYVTSAAGVVQVIDTTTFTTIKTLPVGRIPEDIEISPDGRFGYVANALDGSITMFDTQTYVSETYPVGSQVLGLALIQ